MGSQTNRVMQRNLTRDRYSPQPQRRVGFTTPAVAAALLLVMLGLALIIDRIWLETAKLELTTAAESAALGACRELANDLLLTTDSTVDQRITSARDTAAWIAGLNYVCGMPVTLNMDPEGDVRFGNLVQDNQGVRFDESEVNPSTVVVTALRTRSNNNPIALFVAGASGLPFGDVAVRVEATISNDVIGVRANDDLPIPALPVAILESDPSGQNSATWTNMIESRSGSDQYTFDPTTNAVVGGSDGIPEMVIQGVQTGGNPASANAYLLDLGTGLNDTELARQIRSGLTTDDLETLGGAIIVGQGTTQNLTSSPQFDVAEQTELQNIIGQRRICFLYSATSPGQQPPLATATCSRLVAIRVMAVESHTDGTCIVTVQPTIMTCRNAIRVCETSTDASGNQTNNGSMTAWNPSAYNQTSTTSTANANSYVYKLQLTY